MKKLLILVSTLSIAGVLAWNYLALPVSKEWSTQELALIRSMSLAELPPLPPDSSNAVGDDESAAELGYRLFFDKRMSGNGEVSCASCHQPQQMFTDGLALAVGRGIGTRNTPTLVGLAYSPWFYWDGRKDSQWSQALAPIEASHEHNFTRLEVVRLLANDDFYKARYEILFGALPMLDELPIAPDTATAEVEWLALDAESKASVSRVFSNVGKAIVAYERKLLPGVTRFDAYVQSLEPVSNTPPSDVLNGTEIAGLRLFVSKGQCVNCHNGPLLTNHEFHNTGILSAPGQLPSMGRYDGVRLSRLDPFNCLGEFSDARAEECTELRFARDSNDLVGAHKTPTLRNISLTAPYMHSGQIGTLREVLDHYNEAPLSMLSHNEAKPLGLRTIELRQLEAFLNTLTAPLATPTHWLQTPGN